MDNKPAVINQDQTAVSLLDAPVDNRDAWRLLRAEYSNQNIPGDKWRLLALAFARVPDDVLTKAVIAHMSKSPYFPRLSDINAQMELINPKSTFDDFCERMRRIGYKLINDDGFVASFEGSSHEARIYH